MEGKVRLEIHIPEYFAEVLSTFPKSKVNTPSPSKIFNPFLKLTDSVQRHREHLSINLQIETIELPVYSRNIYEILETLYSLYNFY